MSKMLVGSTWALALALSSCALQDSAGPAAKMAALSTTSNLTLRYNPGSLQTCFNHVHRCIVPVYVHATSATECTAWVDPGEIKVPAAAGAASGVPQIKVVWVLKKGDAATQIGEYRFKTNTNGIALAASQPSNAALQFTADGYDGNDSTNPDPDDPPALGANRRFRWISNPPSDQVTSVTVRYDIHVVRITDAGGVVDCIAGDPTITNTN